MPSGHIVAGAAVIGVGAVAAVTTHTGALDLGLGSSDANTLTLTPADVQALAMGELSVAARLGAAEDSALRASRSRSREAVVELDDQLRAAAVPASAPAPKPAVTTFSRPYSTSAFDAAAGKIGLRGYARTVYSAVRTAFGITNMGGLRPGDPRDHGTGHAVDVMITSRTQGDAVAAFVMAHAAEFHVKYIIWRQRMWYPGGSWQGMADRGGVTANHFDHVHISVTS